MHTNERSGAREMQAGQRMKTSKFPSNYVSNIGCFKPPCVYSTNDAMKTPLLIYGCRPVVNIAKVRTGVKMKVAILVKVLTSYCHVGQSQSRLPFFHQE